MTPVAVLFVLIYGSIAFLALRRKLLTKLAGRSLRRRPGQSALVVAGLMIGTTAITASLIGADSTEDSSVLNSYRAWGNIDYTVTAPNNTFFSREVAGRLADRSSGGASIDGAAAGVGQVG